MGILPILFVLTLEVLLCHGCPSTPKATPAPATTTTTTTTTTHPPPPTNGGQCKCGVSNLFSGTRVVGGWPASPTEVPWQVGITPYATTGATSPVTLICGGSLLNAQFVLTAAHCTQAFGHSPTAFKVVVGLLKRSEFAAVNLFEVSEVNVHPQYNVTLSITGGFDVAIVKLSTPVDFANFPTVYTVCWPTRPEQVGSQAVVSGWGTLEQNGEPPDQLHRVFVPVKSNSPCGEWGTIGLTLTETMICAGEGGRDFCSGDRGGPLMQVHGNRFEQIGVASFTFGCGDAKYPGLYADVYSVMNWIASIAGDECSRV